MIISHEWENVLFLSSSFVLMIVFINAVAVGSMLAISSPLFLQDPNSQHHTWPPHIMGQQF